MDLAQLVSQTDPADWARAAAETEDQDMRALDGDAVAGSMFDDLAPRLAHMSADEIEALAMGTDTLGTGDMAAQRSYWSAIKAEFAKLLCGHKDYDDDRKRAGDLWSTGKDAVLMAISGAIGAVLGMTAVVVLPFVTFLLILASKIGLKTWCAVNYVET